MFSRKKKSRYYFWNTQNSLKRREMLFLIGVRVCVCVRVRVCVCVCVCVCVKTSYNSNACIS